ncbi:MAG: hypothetical protein HRT70_06905 [Flavobacteriaceae bacterium]|nr:hypothetical protein [Flavobacteriaceae bacterium]
MSESPWIKVINFLMLIIISIISYSFVSAKTEIKEDLENHYQKIKDVEEKVQSTEIKLTEVETGFEYIREKLDEISDDVKELQKR